MRANGVIGVRSDSQNTASGPASGFNHMESVLPGSGPLDQRIEDDDHEGDEGTDGDRA